MQRDSIKLASLSRENSFNKGSSYFADFLLVTCHTDDIYNGFSGQYFRTTVRIKSTSSRKISLILHYASHIVSEPLLELNFIFLWNLKAFPIIEV